MQISFWLFIRNNAKFIYKIDLFTGFPRIGVFEKNLFTEFSDTFKLSSMYKGFENATLGTRKRTSTIHMSG